MTKGFLNDDFNAPGDITAGGIENTPIGNTTASTIEGTTGQFSSNVQIDGNILDSNGNEAIGIASTASAVNYVNIVNSPTLNALNIEAAGSDTNIDLKLSSKGTGKTRLFTNGNVGLSLDGNGIVIMPLQSAFMATPSATLSNKTGNNTLYTFVCATEIYDRNSDYDGTSTYTAPITGIYALGFSFSGQGASGLTENLTQIATSNRTYATANMGAAIADSQYYSSSGNVSGADMDSADTVVYRVRMDGIGSDAADFTTSTAIWGRLAC
jgi:hypothetical protein